MQDPVPFRYMLQISRAIRYTDNVPELVSCGSGDYDQTSYHPGWKYWETHSKIIAEGSSYEEISRIRDDFLGKLRHVDGFTNRPYKLEILVSDQGTRVHC